MNNKLYNNLMKDVSKVIKKHLNEVLIDWNEHNYSENNEIIKSSDVKNELNAITLWHKYWNNIKAEYNKLPFLSEELKSLLLPNYGELIYYPNSQSDYGNILTYTQDDDINETIIKFIENYQYGCLINFIFDWDKDDHIEDLIEDFCRVEEEKLKNAKIPFYWELDKVYKCSDIGITLTRDYIINQTKRGNNFTIQEIFKAYYDILLDWIKWIELNLKWIEE